MTTTLSTGVKAPEFSLLDQNGQLHQLRDYVGRLLLLYFYPKDDTPGCTTEACGLRDAWSELTELGVAVLGISADSVQSHAKFADKFKLPFPLLADTDKTMLQAYGVLAEKSMFGKKFIGIKRMSFLIDSEGKIAKIYPAVKPASHASEVLADAQTLLNHEAL